MPPPRISASSCSGTGETLQRRPVRGLRARPGVEVELGRVAFLERRGHARAFERQKAEIDRVAEEQAVDRLRQQEADAAIAQRARRRPGRAHAEIAPADDGVALLHWSTQPGRLAVNTARACSSALAIQVRPGSIRSVLMLSPNFQTRAALITTRLPSKNSAALAMWPASAEAATVAGEAM